MVLQKDRKLPGLEKAVDPAYLQRGLATRWQRINGDAPGSILAVESRVLKYKPGKTCVIEYCLIPADREQYPQYLIGKMYRKNRGEQVYRNLCLLWQHASNGRPASAGGMVFGMAQPLWYDPALGMVFQKKITAPTFEEQIETGNAECAIALVSENLAALHRLALPHSKAKSLAQHVRKFVSPHLDALQQDAPQACAQLTAIIETLSAQHFSNDRQVTPVHGDLNFSQIFLRDGRAFFIDFDGFCFAHPALDVANFMAILLTKLPHSGDGYAQRFLTSYLQHAARERLPGLGPYMALAYLRRAVICLRKKAGAHWRSELVHLLNIAQTYLYPESDKHQTNSVGQVDEF